LASKIPAVEDRIKRDTYAGSPTKDREKANKLRRELFISSNLSLPLTTS
jgi:hypothetical protein